jgi:hypothetical protein
MQGYRRRRRGQLQQNEKEKKKAQPRRDRTLPGKIINKYDEIKKQMG